MRNKQRSLIRLVPGLLGVALLTTLTACDQGTPSGETTPVAAAEPAAPAPASKPAVKTEEKPAPAKTVLAKEPDASAKPAATSADEKVATSKPERPRTRALEDPQTSLLANASADTPTRRSAEETTKVLQMVNVAVEPAVLDLGEIPTNDAKAGVVVLTNNGETPHKIIDCKTSCGCTTANCQKGKMLQPGESMEVEIKLSGGAQPRSLAKTVTFLVSDQKPIRLPVKGQSIAFVNVMPEKLDPEKHPDGQVTLRSIDDKPFSIKSMFPPVVEGLPTEPKVEHVVYINWDALEEQQHRSSKLLFTLDHPKCSKVYGSLSPSALPGRQLAADRADRAIDAKPISPRIDIDKLLSDQNEADFLKHLEAGDIEVDAVDAQGQTALVKAARWGSVGAIEALLDASADIGSADRIGRTPLMYACQSKNVEAVRVLLDAGANVHQRDNIGNTALCWAAGFGDSETVKELLDARAEVEVAGPMTGFTPLIWAAGFGEAESINLLVAAGADLEAKDVLQGATPLMNAARTGGPDNTRALLEAGASLEARDNEGKTVILVAASNAGADADMIKLLVDAGADLAAKTSSGESALDLAMKRTDLRAEGVVEVLKSLEK